MLFVQRARHAAAALAKTPVHARTLASLPDQGPEVVSGLQPSKVEALTRVNQISPDHVRIVTSTPSPRLHINSTAARVADGETWPAPDSPLDAHAGGQEARLRRPGGHRRLRRRRREQHAPRAHVPGLLQFKSGEPLRRRHRKGRRDAPSQRRRVRRARRRHQAAPDERHQGTGREDRQPAHRAQRPPAGGRLRRDLRQHGPVHRIRRHGAERAVGAHARRRGPEVRRAPPGEEGRHRERRRRARGVRCVIWSPRRRGGGRS